MGYVCCSMCSCMLLLPYLLSLPGMLVRTCGNIVYVFLSYIVCIVFIITVVVFILVDWIMRKRESVIISSCGRVAFVLFVF